MTILITIVITAIVTALGLTYANTRYPVIQDKINSVLNVLRRK